MFSSFTGETEKPCVLVLVDDTEHEEEEELRLVLGSPRSDSPFGASIGEQNETLIKIKDEADSKNLFLLYVALCNYFRLRAAMCRIFRYVWIIEVAGI